MNPSKSDVTAGNEPSEIKPKKRRRPRTTVVVRQPRTKLITREEFEMTVSTLTMIAHQPEADRRQTPKTPPGDRTQSGS